MKLTDLSIDNFGALSRLSLPEIGQGLNVFHGPNGSGKTTLLQFIRGIFAGFAEARRLQLIPPVGTGGAGGTIGVEWGSRRLAVIRHSRPDEYETLAINVRQGQSDEGQSLRKHLEAFDDARLSVLFTAGSFDANSVEALIALARQDGIDLVTIPGNERPLSARLTHLHSNRALILKELGASARRTALQAECEAVAQEGLAIQKGADSQRAELLRARLELDQRLATLDREIEALHLEWQAVSTDLSECEDRLWSTTARTVVDIVYVQELEPPALNPRLPEVEELDRRIEHLRTALKDLAATRKQVSVEAAEGAGADVPDRFAFARRQREALRVMQMQLEVLAGTAQWMESAQRTGSCVCESVGERLTSVAEEMRRQVELSCQELSRQQSAWQLEKSRTELAEIETCESSLRQQIERLRLRREELLKTAAHPVQSRLAHTVTCERQYCDCPQHSATMRATTPRVVTRRTTSEREETDSARRPGDEALQQELTARRATLWAQWQDAMASSVAVETQRRNVIEAFRSIDVEAELAACEARLQELRRELLLIERRQEELAAIDSEIRSVESQLVRDRSSRVISEASEHLELLTLGRYPALRTSEDGSKLQIVAENGSPYVSSALSRGTLFQVALALRIALVDEYARRGLDFPLVLDDVLVDSDEHRLEAAAQLLSAATDRGRQVLFLTCQDHLVDLLEDRGAVVHSLPGSQRVRGVHTAFVPAAAPVAVTRPEPAPEPEAPETKFDLTAVEPVRERSSRWDLPASEIPSLSLRSAELLESEGVRTVGQVMELDSHTSLPLLARLGLSRLDLAIWKAEATLLTGLAELSKDDVRLLAAVGVSSAEELAKFTPLSLWQRIQRFRGSTPQPWHAWIRDRNSWPAEDELAMWIRLARKPDVTFERREVLSLAANDEPGDDPDDDGPQPAGTVDGVSRKRGRRSRRRFAASAGRRTGGGATAEGDRRFYLTLDSAIVDAPSIGPKTARILNRAGVQTVSHLLQRSAEELAGNISDRTITAEIITAWQRQSRLMCETPELRGHDAQLLVACGYLSVDALAGATCSEVFESLGAFAKSKPGQRMLRSSAPPERSEISGWIEFATELANRKAA